MYYYHLDKKTKHTHEEIVEYHFPFSTSTTSTAPCFVSTNGGQKYHWRAIGNLFYSGSKNCFNDMTELKIMYLLEIWMYESDLWHKFKPSQDRVLSSVIFTQFWLFYFPGYNAIILRSGNIETVFWATVSMVVLYDSCSALQVKSVIIIQLLITTVIVVTHHLRWHTNKLVNMLMHIWVY